MYARTRTSFSLPSANIGLNLSSDSAMLQLVFFCVNASVAAVNIESSTSGLGACSEGGEGGGVRGSWEDCIEEGLR